MNFRILLGLFLVGCGPKPGGPPPPAAVCDLSGATTFEHAAGPTSSETWASGIHHVSGNLVVPSGVLLTIAGCSRVVLEPDVGFSVRGSLVSAGSSTDPVTFERAVEGKPWGAIALTPGASAQLASTTLAGGGGSAPIEGSATLGAPLFAQGSGNSPVEMIKVTDVAIQGATGVGVALINAAFDSTSANLTVHGAGSFAAYLGFDVLDTLPSGNFTENAINAIALQSAFFAAQSNERIVGRDLTVHDPGVAYVVGMKDAATLKIGGPGLPPATVTIKPNVTFAFTRGSTRGGQVVVNGDAGGTLIALGTSGFPIIFTSAAPTPAAGDWMGVRLVGLAPLTQLTLVEIDDAGAPSGVVGTCITNAGGTSDRSADAALQVMLGALSPVAPFFTNSFINDSAGNGIYRGWKGADFSLLPTNSLIGIPWCSETLVPNAANACIGTCPQAH